MATSGLYGSSTANAVIATAGAESNGLYGGGVSFGGSYFEWFIFKEAVSQPATPTGGSWRFYDQHRDCPNGMDATAPYNPHKTRFGIYFVCLL